MSDPANWQSDNARFLDAALAWLRELLELHGQPAGVLPSRVQPSAPPSSARPPQRSLWRQIVLRDPGPTPAVAKPDVVVMSNTAQDTGEDATRISADPNAIAAQMTPPPALMMLSQQLGLTRFEQNVLLLCVAMELDTSIAALCALAEGDPDRRYPNFALALSLFNEPTWDALSPERPLRYWRLIEITQPSGLPLTVSPLRADERIVNYIKGLSYVDDRLTPLLSPLPMPESAGDTPASQRTNAQRIVDELKQVPAGRNLPVVQLLGADSASKRLVAGLACNALGRRPYILSSSLIPSSPGDLETLARLWQRESLILPVALYIETAATEGEGSSATQAAALNRLLTRLGGVVFLDARDLWPGLSQPAIAVDVAKPVPEEQQAAWTTALGEAAGDSPAQLAGQFNLNLDDIREIASKTISALAPHDPALHSRLWSACLAKTRPRLDTLAQRLEPKATWDDLVLPAAETNLLHQIAEQVGQRATVYQTWGFGKKMNRGLGINALFCGDSGGGKTMAAEVIANHLQLNLYRIDLSAVMSKYIGETEKNLRRLFDAAEDGGAILFFDEADALFGKRSEVKDSHDRYANIEINYLLQRMESYGGLAILATNMKSALDPAFLRRLRFVVNFPFPGTPERKAMWQKIFPSTTPTASLDFDRLARFDFNGGHIALVAMNAAFMAAQAHSQITMAIVLEAARVEFRKLERPVSAADFRLPSPVKVA